MRSLAALILPCLLPACAAAPPSTGPLPVAAQERAALAADDVAGFWQARDARGDPVARTAMAVLRRPPGPLGALGRMSFAFYRATQPDPAPEAAISLAIARAHADAVGTDRDGTPAHLSAEQIAAYHHRVLARFGLPAFAFGASQFTGTLREARLLAPLWCRGCDR